MSAAPRFTTADIAKGAQQPGDARQQAEAREVEARQAEERARTEAALREQNAAREPDAQRAVDMQREQDRQRARDQAMQHDATPAHTSESEAPLFAHDAAEGFRRRWDTIQASFVDDPRQAVQEADSLVAETMQRLADTFAQERSRLEQQFDRDRNASTEDLRVTLRHYRSYFARLLSV